MQLEKVIPGADLFTEKKVEVGDIELNIAIAGSGDTILMIPGFSSTWHTLAPLGQQLVKDYEVIIIEPPGFGKSDRMDKYMLEVSTEYMAQFIYDRQESKPVKYTLGVSVGSLFTARIASIYPFADVEKSIHISPPLHLDSLKALKWILFPTLRATKHIPGGPDFVRRIQMTPLVEKFMAANNNYKDYNKMQTVSRAFNTLGKGQMHGQAFVELAVQVSKLNVPEWYQDIKIPSLFLYSDVEADNQIHSIKSLAGSNKLLYSKQIDNTGHSLHIETPKETAAAVKEFLE